MIEKFISYSDLLALLLAIAISGLIIFFLFFMGATHSETDHGGTEAHLDTDTDMDTDIDSDVHIDLDHDIDASTDFDNDLDTDTDFDHDLDTDTDLSHDLDTDTDLDHDVHEISNEAGLHLEFDGHIDGELVKTIETDGGGSLFAQIGAFCLAFGLFGFFFVLSIGPVETSVLISKLDIAVGVLFLLGVAAFKLSNKALKLLTKGSISPVSEILPGQEITVVSKMIDYQTQGRVLVLTPDGEKIMMAISNDMYDLFYEGDKGIIQITGVPLRISKDITNLSRKVKGI